jgi:hypothetical protein
MGAGRGMGRVARHVTAGAARLCLIIVVAGVVLAALVEHGLAEQDETSARSQAGRGQADNRRYLGASGSSPMK